VPEAPGVLWITVSVKSNGGTVKNAHGLTVRSVIGEFRGVVEDQNHFLGGGEPITRGLKVPGKNLGFRDTPVRKEAIGRFGVGPILTN
jgi:hypothetical protein